MINLYDKICVICGQPFRCRDKRTEYCSNQCRKALNRQKYKNKTIECICDKCGIHYQATQKQLKHRCSECTKKYKIYTTTKMFQQNIVCRHCGKVIKVIPKHYSSKYALDLKILVCDECKKLSRQNSSYRMKLCNPSYSENLTDEQYRIKQQLKLYKKSDAYKQQRKKELSKQFSQRMKMNNPMYNPKTVNKVRQTIISGYKSGKYKKYLGKDNWNYKGNRSISNYLRLSLNEWRKNNLIRTDYTCECCNIRGGYLHIHHKIPFRDIMQMGLNQLNLNIDMLEFRNEAFNRLEQWIVDYHNNNDVGIVVCRKCHARIDNKYYPPKKILEEGNDETTQ